MKHRKRTVFGEDVKDLTERKFGSVSEQGGKGMLNSENITYG